MLSSTTFNYTRVITLFFCLFLVSVDHHGFIAPTQTTSGNISIMPSGTSTTAPQPIAVPMRAFVSAQGISQTAMTLEPSLLRALGLAGKSAKEAVLATVKHNARAGRALLTVGGHVLTGIKTSVGYVFNTGETVIVGTYKYSKQGGSWVFRKGRQAVGGTIGGVGSAMGKTGKGIKKVGTAIKPTPKQVRQAKNYRRLL